MKKLTVDVVVEINRRMISDYSQGEMFGVKEINLLESAVERPFQTMFGDELYPTLFDKATALFESIAKNHALFNGNKRTALACTLYFLYINGQLCFMDEHEAANLVVDFVTNEKSFEDVSQTLRDYSHTLRQ